jgi:hypothetical protein
MHLLQMFFSHQIQPLRRRRTKMWMYPRPSSLVRPSSEELSVIEVEAWIHMVLDLGVNQNSSPVPVPLRRVVTSIRVSTLDPILAAFTILSFHHGHDLALSVGGWPWRITGCQRALGCRQAGDETPL